MHMIRKEPDVKIFDGAKSDDEEWPSPLLTLILFVLTNSEVVLTSCHYSVLFHNHMNCMNVLLESIQE